jgi:predicted kinase
MKEKLIVWVLCGAPGSGKTTFGKTLAEGDPRIVRVCPDDNRRIIGKGSHDQTVSYPAFCMAKDQMRKALDEGKCVIFDATNMYRKARKDFVNLARGRGAKVIAQVFECSKSVLVGRNIKRGSEGGRNVPEKVIDDMLARYQRPEVPEFDEVVFVNKL